MPTTREQQPQLDTEVRIPVDHVTLEGTLFRPPDASAIVVFAHGTESGRLSARNMFVASELHREGIATLLIDLFTAREELADRHAPSLRYDVETLAERLVLTIDWALKAPGLEELRFGVCGAGAGGAAALAVAAARPYVVQAVVCRSARSDLAAAHLRFVNAPTLFIAGEFDGPVIAVNEQALSEMKCDVKLEVVRGASHLLDEPGAMQRAAEITREWFDRHLVRHWANHAGMSGNA